MKNLSKFGVIFTLVVLLLSLSISAVSADTGDNLFFDPEFTSISHESSGQGSAWFYHTSGSGSGNVYSNNGACFDITAASGQFMYAYLRTFSRLDLSLVSSISVSNSVSSGTIQSLNCEVSSDGNNWDTLTKKSGRYTGTVTWDVSGYSSVYYVRFSMSAYNGGHLVSTLTNPKALDATSAPTFSSATSFPSVISVSDSINTTVTYTAGYPASTTVYVDWGDGGATSKSSGENFVHTYSTVGTYNVQSKAYNSIKTSDYTQLGTVKVTPKITSVTTSGATFVGGNASVTPGTVVYFYASYNGQISSGNAFSWSVGGNEVLDDQDYYYTFSNNGDYEVKVKVSGSTGYSPYYTVGTIHVGSNSISIDSSTGVYDEGNIANISWSLNNPDFTQTYSLQIFQSDSTGTISGSAIVTNPITSASVTHYDWNTTGASGYYIAKIYKNSVTEIASSRVFSVQKLVTLWVTLTKSSVTYTNETTVTLYKDGAIAYQQTVNNGTAVFSFIPSGTYTVEAETVGYASQSISINLLTSNTLNIDFVNGISDTQQIGGAGGAYSVTYVTFRVIDRNTGSTVSGAYINGSAVAATNPLEWIANWFGAAFGNSVIGTNIEGTSDDNGVVSFVMYPNLRYSLTLTHSGLLEPSTRTFSPSSLSAEYPWYITFPEVDTGTTKNIKVTVNVSDDGLVSAHYTDLTLSTTTVNLTVLTKDDNGNYNITMGTASAGGNDVPLEVQLTGYSGKDIKVVVQSQTTAYGTVTKVYYHTFLGPWLDLGLPSDIYIWICLLTAILIGGVATYINSYAACFVIVFFEWVFWSFGWFFQVGQMVVLPLLIAATVFSVVFYMQSRK